MAKRKNQAIRPKNTAAPTVQEFYSAGRYSTVEENGTVSHNMAALSRVSAARRAKAAAKTASLFADGELGPANIADSNNIGYYSYQFPVDAMEMPASRAEELEFYRLAYTRDPIVARAIDLHTELPLSKMRIEKPKCSVEAFSDYVYDYFQRLMNDTRLFSTLIDATREYHTIGEAFLFVQQPEDYMDLTLCPAAAKALKRGRGFQSGVAPMTEAANAPIIGQEREVLPDFVEARRKSSAKLAKQAAQALEKDLSEEGIKFDPEEDPDDVQRVIVRRKAKLAKLLKKQAAMKTAEPAAPAAEPAPGGDAPTPDAGGADAAPAEGGEGGEIPGGDGLDGGMPGGDMGGGGMPMGGGGGGFGGGSIPSDLAEPANNAVQVADDAKRAREINDLQRYIHLLERKKGLLEELLDLAETRRLEEEIFKHIVNDNFEGFEHIQILQPERITMEPGGDEASIIYKPSEEEKAEYLNDPDVPDHVKDELEETGSLGLNRNPFSGSYVVHFARKKSGYEQHGRSALQSCMRAIIYREKLRQVQTTLASRNMTPKTLITAPGVSEVQVAQLRAHADEAKSDPDYTIVTNYEVTWNEIDSQSRLLSLADEWQHTNSNLAIGLGFSPEILIGEGMYGSNRIQLDMMSVTYTQFREELSDVVENHIFKPIAMLKGFYEQDNYGRPRWIYPKITFGQLALRDSGDLYEMMFNLYSKGSLPVSTIYEFLGMDTETITRELEDDLFSVRDSKFNELLSAVYSTLGGEMVGRTDIIKRITKSMSLEEQAPAQQGMEGSGEGL